MGVPWSFMSLWMLSPLPASEASPSSKGKHGRLGLSASLPACPHHSVIRAPTHLGFSGIVYSWWAIRNSHRMRWRGLANIYCAYLFSYACCVVPLGPLWILVTKQSSKRKLLKISNWQPKSITVSVRPSWVRDYTTAQVTHPDSQPCRRAAVWWVGQGKEESLGNESHPGLGSGLKAARLGTLPWWEWGS